MRAWSVALLLLAVGATSGCGDAPEPKQQTQKAKEESSAEPSDEEREKLYGPQGELLASDEQVAGLSLPRGLKLHRRTDRRRIYYTKVSLQKVQRYFGPRLITGEVERRGDGAIYRSAVPRDVKGGVVKLDVSILPTPDGTRVSIHEIRPAPKNPLPRAEIVRRLREQQKYAD